MELKKIYFLTVYLQNVSFICCIGVYCKIFFSNDNCQNGKVLNRHFLEYFTFCGFFLTMKSIIKENYLYNFEIKFISIRK